LKAKVRKISRFRLSKIAKKFQDLQNLQPETFFLLLISTKKENVQPEVQKILKMTGFDKLLL